MTRSRTAAHRIVVRAVTLSLVAALTTLAPAGLATGAHASTGPESPESSPRSGPRPAPGPAPAEATPAEVSMDSLDVPETDAPDGPEGPDGPDGHGGHRAHEVVAELSASRTDYFGLVGVTWRGGYDDRGLEVEIRTHTGGDWTAWEQLEVDDHQDAATAAETHARGGTVPAWVGGADGIGVRLLSEDGTAPEDVEVALIDGGTGYAEQPDGGSALPAGQLGRAAPRLALSTADGTTADGTTPGVTARPTIVTRAEWGVDSSTEVACSTPRFASTMRGIVLHHTAGSNDYTAAQAPGIVRAVHRYHTVAQKWCDIGYNFLVDKYGVVYEGRRGGIEKQVRGAHAGDWLVNKWTTGISMMGNFETAQPTTAMKDAVVDLMAWRLSLFGRDALDTMLIDDVEYQRIIGHRNVKSTACPGKNAYTWLNNGLREEVQAVIDAAPPAPEPAPTEPAPTEPPEPSTSRYAGDSRYSTAASIARRSFPDPVDAVFLASGDSFPDALSGGPAAARGTVPVLLVRPGEIPAETASELSRLQPGTIYLLGGEGAVSDDVFTQAQGYAPTVTRLRGSNRYSTGVTVAKRFWPGGAGTVYLASGADYPDALSGGALAARTGAPILLSKPERLPGPVSEELTRLHPSSVVLLGGPGAVSEQVAAEVSQLLPAASVNRLAGPDRYATSAVIAAYGWSTATRGYFAAGGNFPDALAGVPAAGKSQAPLLLARRTCLPGPVEDQLTRLAPPERVLLGGAAVLAEDTLTHRCPS